MWGVGWGVDGFGAAAGDAAEPAVRTKTDP